MKNNSANTNQNTLDSFTMLNSKELYRGVRELPAKPFIIFIIIAFLIVRHNSRNNCRRLSIEELLDVIPFSLSPNTLRKCLNELKEKQFITSFQDEKTNHHVYSLLAPHEVGASGGYSKIKDIVFYDLLKALTDPRAMRLYILIYLGNTAFKEECGMNKTLWDLCRMVGKTPTRGNRDITAKGLKTLRDVGLINYTEEQNHIYQRKKFTLALIDKWCLDDTGGKRNLDNITNAIQITCKRNLDNTHPIKETILKKETNSIKEYPNFDFHGMDKLKNPLRMHSIKAILNDTQLTFRQVQDSVKDFMEYFNSGRCREDFRNPAGFLCNHFRKFGIYIPPERYLKDRHKFILADKISSEELQEQSKHLNRDSPDIDLAECVLSMWNFMSKEGKYKLGQVNCLTEAQIDCITEHSKTVLKDINAWGRYFTTLSERPSLLEAISNAPETAFDFCMKLNTITDVTDGKYQTEMSTKGIVQCIDAIHNLGRAQNG